MSKNLSVAGRSKAGLLLLFQGIYSLKRLVNNLLRCYNSIMN